MSIAQSTTIDIDDIIIIIINTLCMHQYYAIHDCSLIIIITGTI
jgi:hypothetical protein